MCVVCTGSSCGSKRDRRDTGRCNRHPSQQCPRAHLRRGPWHGSFQLHKAAHEGSPVCAPSPRGVENWPVRRFVQRRHGHLRPNADLAPQGEGRGEAEWGVCPGGPSRTRSILIHSERGRATGTARCAPRSADLLFTSVIVCYNQSVHLYDGPVV